MKDGAQATSKWSPDAWGRPPGFAALALCLFLHFSITSLLHHSPADAASPLGAAQRAFQLQGAHYGTLPDDHPAVLRSAGIFKKLVRVAGAPPGLSLSVHVLATPKVIAQSYGQGVIVVSSGLLDLVGADDDALAFVLGHEIAHQVRGHESILLGFGVQNTPATPSAPSHRPEVVTAFQTIELDADRFGFLYASLAGYQARAAIGTIGAVAEALGADPLHPDSRQRAGEIRRQVSEVLDNYEAYLLGLVYLAMGRLEGAARIFEEMLSIYPSRELFLNLGTAYHKTALRYAQDDGFRRSILIDPRSRIATTLKGPGETTSHPLFAQYLERAIEAYKRATAMDPEDAVSHNNLGVAYLDGGQFEYALGEFRAALQTDAGFVAAYNNRGITRAKMGDLKRAEADLLEAAAKDPQYVPAFENLAMVYQRLGNAAEGRKAEEASTRLAQARMPGRIPAGPPTISGVRLQMPSAEAERLLGGRASRQISIPLSVTPGDDVVLRVYSQRGLAVAMEKGVVSAIGIVRKGAAILPGGVDIGIPSDRLRQVYGSPTRTENVREVSLWVYPDHGLAVFVASGRVNGMWAVKAGME